LAGQPIPADGNDIEHTASGVLEGEHAPFARDVLGLKMKFLEMMDDDFNTAGAIAVLHEIAGTINGFVEHNNLERSARPQLVGLTVSAAVTLRNLGRILGLFGQFAPGAGSAAAATVAPIDTGLTDQLMTLLIQLRADARKSRSFALADAIRKGLTDIGITLEDRADGTIWRKD
jgi:cysteinyl-tRNA synthetase